MDRPSELQAFNGPCTGEGQSFGETGAAARARYMKGQIARYVVGFMFDFAFERVALIRKQKPAWQAGKLNGIGGKIEPGETREEAMTREFIEEAGFDLDWHFYCNCAGTNNDGSLFSLDCFWSQGPVQDLKSQEAEQIEILTLTQVIVRRREMIGNLPWHLELARDFASGVFPPRIVFAEYGPSYPKAPKSDAVTGASIPKSLSSEGTNQ